MALFNFFKKQISEVQATPEIKEAQFIDNSEPRTDNVVTIAYGTNMPIDAIYAFIKKDMEYEGYQDALCNWENQYKETRILMIRNELKQLFNQVRLRYKTDSKDLAVKLEIMKSQGLIGSAFAIEAQQEIITAHMERIDEMEKALNNNDPEMTIMIMSYERGFMRGVAARVTSMSPVAAQNFNAVSTPSNNQ